MKLLNFGSCNVDFVYSLDHVVKPGETQSAANLSVFSGGKGLNQSIAIARAGAKVYHAGCIGEDGEFLAELLLENGVDTKYLKRVKNKNGHAIIQVTSEGENSIVIYSGSNGMISRDDIDEVLRDFSSGDMLLLQNEISNVPYLIDRAYEKGMKVILNPSPITDDLLKIDFKKLSYIVLNEIEAAAITGAQSGDAALEVLRRDYPELVIILTLGSRGSIYQDSEKRLYQPAYKVEVKDTTAAGDTFTGYFVAEIAKGVRVKSALATASIASAIAVSRHGAAPSVPIMSEVVKAKSVLKPRGGDPRAEATKRLIAEHTEENLSTVSIKSLAGRLGYSVVYTGRLVNKLLGVSYTDYLMEMRMSRAAQLLSESDASIAEIIGVIGYENQSFFRKKFIEKYGVKPLEYRKCCKK